MLQSYPESGLLADHRQNPTTSKLNQVQASLKISAKSACDYCTILLTDKHRIGRSANFFCLLLEMFRLVRLTVRRIRLFGRCCVLCLGVVTAGACLLQLLISGDAVIMKMGRCVERHYLRV